MRPFDRTTPVPSPVWPSPKSGRLRWVLALLGALAFLFLPALLLIVGCTGAGAVQPLDWNDPASVVTWQRRVETAAAIAAEAGAGRMKPDERDLAADLLSAMADALTGDPNLASSASELAANLAEKKFPPSDQRTRAAALAGIVVAAVVAELPATDQQAKLASLFVPAMRRAASILKPPPAVPPPPPPAAGPVSAESASAEAGR